jgi:ABC-type transporter Mla subunit MlaD
MANQHDRNAFKAGLFIIISIFLIVALILGIKGVSRFVVPSQDRTVRFALSDDIGGLSPGDDVRIGGAKVGVVRSIDIQVGDDATKSTTKDSKVSGSAIVIEFTMPKQYKVRQNAQITVQSTVTGVSVLNFASLGEGDEVPESDMLVGQPGGLSSLLASAGVIGPEVEGLIHDVRGTTLPKVNTTIEKGANALDQVSSIFSDTKTDIRMTIANLHAVTDSVKEKLPGILDQTHGVLAKVTTAVDRTSDALVDVKAVAANARDISASARQIILGNRGKIESMITSLRDTGENLKNASAEISRSPWRLLYHPSPGEMANLNLYDSARQFADGADKLSDAATSLRDAIQSKSGDPKELQVLLQKLDDSFSHFNEVENRLWSQVKQ